VRIYLPGTVRTLHQLGDAGAVGPAPITAFAVTPGLRAWYEDDDVDELEYAAAGEAARASLRLLGGTELPARRVVLSAEVPDAAVEVRDDLDRGVVRLAEPVPLAQLASLHIDEAEAAAVVRLAADAIDAADLGDEDAQAIVDDAEGYELAWFGVQELALLLADPDLALE
jgi:hypothetical protein